MSEITKLFRFLNSPNEEIRHYDGRFYREGKMRLCFNEHSYPFREDFTFSGEMKISKWIEYKGKNGVIFWKYEIEHDFPTRTRIGRGKELTWILGPQFRYNFCSNRPWHFTKGKSAVKMTIGRGKTPTQILIY